jgi:hypothetical protein
MSLAEMNLRCSLFLVVDQGDTEGASDFISHLRRRGVREKLLPESKR